MPRYGDKLQALLRQQDEQVQALARAANAQVSPVWESQSALDLVRELNELGTREDVYSSWLQPGSKEGRFEKPTIRTVDWTGSPLAQYGFYRSAVQVLAHNTPTYVTFDDFRGDTSYFFVDPADATIIRFRTQMKRFQISGTAHWEANATGFRRLYAEVFTSEDVSLGVTPLHAVPAVSGLQTTAPVSYTTDYATYTDIAYLKFQALQTSGGALDLLLYLGMFVV